MVLELRQQLKLTQQLIMTPQLQQAIKLLQLSRMELTETVQQEMEQNPLLEEDSGAAGAEDAPEAAGPEPSIEGEAPPEEATPPPPVERTAEISLENTSTGLDEINWADYENEYDPATMYKTREDGDLPSRFDILTRKPSLQDHLHWQLKFANLTQDEETVGHFIIGNLDADGFLKADEAEITQATGCTPEIFQSMLAMVQDMDPPGVGARNLKECLLLQLAHLGLSDSSAFVIVRDCLHDLERKNYHAITRATGYTMNEVLAAVEVVTGLTPHPGRPFSDEEPHYIVPDVYVYKLDDEYVIQLNDDGLPRLKVSSLYKDILKDKTAGPGVGAETKGYIQDKMKSAIWLIKSIQQRQRTIYKVVESIVKFQRDFFERGPEHLKPLILRDVADDIGMHESTISRVTTNKYVHTPQGIYELKYFFNSSIERLDGEDAMASESIKVRLRQIVGGENQEKPLSDMAIAKIFAREGIKIARRTIAKYREQIGILPSKYRKKPKMR